MDEVNDWGWQHATDQQRIDLAEKESKKGTFYFSAGAVSPERGMFGFLLAECVGGGLYTAGGG